MKLEGIPSTVIAVVSGIVLLHALALAYWAREALKKPALVTKDDLKKLK